MITRKLVRNGDRFRIPITATIIGAVAVPSTGEVAIDFWNQTEGQALMLIQVLVRKPGDELPNGRVFSIPVKIDDHNYLCYCCLGE